MKGEGWTERYLVIMTTIADYVYGFDDIDVFQARADAELGSHLFLVFTL